MIIFVIVQKTAVGRPKAFITKREPKKLQITTLHFT